VCVCTFVCSVIRRRSERAAVVRARKGRLFFLISARGPRRVSWRGITCIYVGPTGYGCPGDCGGFSVKRRWRVAARSKLKSALESNDKMTRRVLAVVDPPRRKLNIPAAYCIREKTPIEFNPIRVFVYTHTRARAINNDAARINKLYAPRINNNIYNVRCVPIQSFYVRFRYGEVLLASGRNRQPLHHRTARYVHETYTPSQISARSQCERLIVDSQIQSGYFPNR